MTRDEIILVAILGHHMFNAVVENAFGEGQLITDGAMQFLNVLVETSIMFKPDQYSTLTPNKILLELDENFLMNFLDQQPVELAFVELVSVSSSAVIEAVDDQIEDVNVVSSEACRLILRMISCWRLTAVMTAPMSCDRWSMSRCR